jgi:hypothetical protein
MTQNDIASSNRLADLAAQIRVEHEAFTAAMKRGVQHAVTAGEMLIEAKARMKHGQWLPWLRDHCSMPGRTASLYMRMAAHRAELSDENGNVADLSLRGAIAMLAPESEGEKILKRIAEADRQIRDAVEAQIEAQRDIANEFFALPLHERSAFLDSLYPDCNIVCPRAQLPRRMPRWRDGVASEVLWEVWRILD